MISRQKLITLLLFLVAGISTAQSFDFKQLSETTNEQAQNEINQALTNLDFIEAVENWYENKKDKYTGPTYIIKHETGKDIVAVATTIGTGGLAGATKITKGVDLLKEVVERVKKVDVGGLTELIAQIKAKFPKEFMDVWDNFIADFGDNTELLKLFDEKPELVGAWKTCFNRSNLRTNISFLETIDGLVKNTAKGIDYAKIETALNGNFGAIIANASGDDLARMIERIQMDHFDAGHLDDIMERLDNPSYKIKEDLMEHPEAFKDFDEMIENPGFFWEKYSEGDFVSGSNLERWARWKWFKDLGQKARKFEDVAAYDEFIDVHGLTDDEIVKQVTLEIDGIRIRIDYLGLKKGKYYFGEAKFSTKNKNWSTDWFNAATKNQKPVFRAFQNGEVNSIIVKATDRKKLNLLNERLRLTNNGSIAFDQTKLSVIGSEAGQQSVKSVVNIK